jgi:hypothetical protein
MRTPQKLPPTPAAPHLGRPLTIDDLTEDDLHEGLKAMAKGRRGIALAIRVAKEAAPGPSWRPAATAPRTAEPVLAMWNLIPGKPILKVMCLGSVWRAVVTTPDDLASSKLVEISGFSHWCPIPEVSGEV